ncbi:MAG: hypothetical protein ACPGQL_05390 [Thermoplasmatota archaeon]
MATATPAEAVRLAASLPFPDDAPEPWPLPDLEGPAEGLERLAAALGHPWGEAEQEAAAALDGWPEPHRRQLAGLLAAHLAVEEATQARRTAAVPDAWDTWRISITQAALAQAALDVAAQWTPLPPGQPASITLPPLAAIHAGAQDQGHVDPAAFSFDAGGDDTYANRAGGSGCASRDGPHAATLIDLGGDDHYAPRDGCGVNGGGAFGGTGTLIDLSGHDRYMAPPATCPGLLGLGIGEGSCGANGGAVGGNGFLFDLQGEDRYAAHGVGANGGAYVGGRGLLVDLAGNDRYDGGGGSGVNGGAHLWSVGTLIDRGGDDVYQAGRAGVNGGGDGGRGHLIDLGGAAELTGSGPSANGGSTKALGDLAQLIWGRRVDMVPGQGYLHHDPPWAS